MINYSQAQNSSNPLVSIIVVNWNGKQHLPINLASLDEQTYQDKEIVFVDNGSEDGSVEFVKKNFPRVKIIHLEKNLGFAEGNNIGILATNNTYVALVNNDTEVDTKWLEICVDVLEKNQDVGFVASRLMHYRQRGLIDACGDKYFSSGYPDKRGWLQPFGREFEKPEWVFGACAGAAVYRRKMLEEVGLFDEMYFNYQEDVDLSFRAQLMGYRCLYVPDAIVYHKVSATAGLNSNQRIYWSHRNHWFTLIKDLPAVLFVKYLFPILLAEFVICIQAIVNRKYLNFLRARFDVLKAFPKLIQERKRIQATRRVPIEYLDSIINKDWLKYRFAAKKREALFMGRLKQKAS